MEPNYEVQTAHQESDLFQDHETYKLASQGQRLLNFIIDNLFMRFVLSMATGYVTGYLLAAIAPDFLLDVAYEIEIGPKTWKYWFLVIILGYFNYLIYYTFCEMVFKGYTLGKLLTGTKAIRVDGLQMTFKDVVIRSLSRIVPFEVFSGLGDKPWHDSWSRTMVVKTR
ncbi:MAG TPA: RDD family protein [Chitinophagaceae bacterium]|jgi:uncharacterized RDD family membrane protein YckC|nr:RDD family protein [Chitinophagaceae bacterium]OPZ19050.1 MAG: RDD family protein [Bacteroidetes bacterium ADurb.BinA245]HMW65810.1 RDD family protein [Chitinophagaceae bacterium]HMX76559.1 RDD family protein [Chitinophagaceae bacterium]HNC39641.1 RDD family protein [Chitinophagaceae bacterium]